MDEPDVQWLIKELAETGADPFWVLKLLPLNRRRLQQSDQSQQQPPNGWRQPGALASHTG
jgi:hypothetical protein